MSDASYADYDPDVSGWSVWCRRGDPEKCRRFDAACTNRHSRPTPHRTPQTAPVEVAPAPTPTHPLPEPTEVYGEYDDDAPCPRCFMPADDPYADEPAGYVGVFCREVPPRCGLCCSPDCTHPCDEANA